MRHQGAKVGGLERSWASVGPTRGHSLPCGLTEYAKASLTGICGEMQTRTRRSPDIPRGPESCPWRTPPVSVPWGSVTHLYSLTFQKGSPLSCGSLCGLWAASMQRGFRTPAHGGSGSPHPRPPSMHCAGLVTGTPTEQHPGQTAWMFGSFWSRLPLGEARAPLWDSVSHFVGGGSRS